MCISDAVKMSELFGYVKRIADLQNPKPAETNAPVPNAVNKERKKVSKRRVRPRNLRMRGGPGKRSMFGTQENENANGSRNIWLKEGSSTKEVNAYCWAEEVARSIKEKDYEV